MERRTVLKGITALGLGAAMPFGKMLGAGVRNGKNSGADCVLIPQETEGPYILDLSSNSSIFRQNITEGRPGTPLNLTLTVVNINDNCAPITNARVDVWHCDKDGIYSGFNNQPGGVNTTGQTFCRGIQMTDSKGQAKFVTMYPGWYQGRITHIHFQVYISSLLKATSQLAFPDSLNTAVYNTSLYTHGQNSSVANNNADMVFGSPSGALQYELATVIANVSGGYDASLTIGIDAPKSGIINLEPETGNQFSLGQNFPNPFRDKTTIPFTLKAASRVSLELYNTSGANVAHLMDAQLSPGNHKYELNLKSLRETLPSGNYLYQITTENANGRFNQLKVLTILGK